MKPSFQSKAIRALLAAGFPFLCYVATVSGYGYWLDSGEFVAQAATLGISHPPGHPLSGLILSFAYILPIGPFSFRVAIVCAFCMALTCLVFDQLMAIIIRSMGIEDLTIESIISIGATWTFAFAYGCWLQAVRPEVYALQAFLGLWMIERLITIEYSFPARKLTPFYTACFLFGLGLANHHLLTFLILPAAMPTVARIFLHQGRRPIFHGAFLSILGLGTYAYLPLRALAHPALALGEPTDLSRFLWVIRAEAFQKNQGEGVPQPVAERILDVLVLLADNIHIVGFIVALGGFYLMVRRPLSQRLASTLGIASLVFILARAWLGFVRSNPDALGYLIPAIAIFIAFATTLFSALINVLVHGTRKFRSFALILSLALPLFGVFQITRSASSAALTRFNATDTLDELFRRSVPSRAVVISFFPQTAFRYWGGEAEEILRPDITFISMPFLSYPGMIESLIKNEPALAPMLRSYILDGTLSQSTLQTLASHRPVLIELDPRVPISLYETLVPKLGYYEVFADGVTDGDERLGRRLQQPLWQNTNELLNPIEDPETRNFIVWHRYHAALYYASFGDKEGAQNEVMTALQLSPESIELRALAQALSRMRRSRFDIRPFLIQSQ